MLHESVAAAPLVHSHTGFRTLSMALVKNVTLPVDVLNSMEPCALPFARRRPVASAYEFLAPPAGSTQPPAGTTKARTPSA